MGTYSEVAILIRKRDVKRLFAEIAKRPKDDIARWFVEHAEKADVSEFDTNPDGAQILRWSEVKWYEEFEEVQYIMNFIRSLGEGNYEYMRIGPDEDDNEHEGNIEGDQCLHLKRYISFDPESLPWPQNW